MRRVVLWIAGVLVLAGIAIQFVPVDRSNPSSSAPLSTDPAVMEVLRTSCYDCHSSETVWPWYSRVAPVSWLVAKDVRNGRRHLNFSEWERFAPGDKAHAAEEIIEEVEEGAMPLPVYLRMHPEARLTPEQIQLLDRWAAAFEAGEGSNRSGRDNQQSGRHGGERDGHEQHDD